MDENNIESDGRILCYNGSYIDLHAVVVIHEGKLIFNKHKFEIKIEDIEEVTRLWKESLSIQKTTPEFIKDFVREYIEAKEQFKTLLDLGTLG